MDSPERKKEQTENGDISVASYGYDSSDVLVASNGDSGQEWVVDSGCSFHMTPNKHWIKYFKDSEGGMVLLGNIKACNVKGSGSVVIKLSSGQQKVVTPMKYVLDSKETCYLLEC